MHRLTPTRRFYRLRLWNPFISLKPLNFEANEGEEQVLDVSTLSATLQASMPGPAQ